ncbi:DNA replication and repair protein RecF [Microcystis aeruginosa NIES-87]|uniref:AAA family ATPase n=2 Tax=Microcystis TaxID=1125 RepID=UPI000CACB4F7|nr:AAA family ATPase [Microcystis aeruginosa]WNF13247.1 AAA family ATPase [Microcystis aeruginosa NRERC-214]GBE73061.1 DNA replication and repair protein RecF [Microcystis aeruginosa NIES-87]
MLTSLTLGNFKSYQEATLSLAPITLLIGANASGKSNALEAIRLLSWLAKGSRLDDIGDKI